jgi:hypothetical protein
MNRVLYVTSFNGPLFVATGSKLIHSFNKRNVEGDLFIAYEDAIKFPEFDENNQRIKNRILHKMDDDPFLLKWLKENEDIIPQKYGGKAPLCDGCPNPNDNWRGHVDGCLNGTYHSRVSHWFRKIVALKAALDRHKDDYDIFVWCDCDIIFKDRLTNDFLLEVLGHHGAFYFLGPHRRKVKSGVESGFMAFSKTNGGYKFIETVISKFEDGSFRDYERRNDGYIFEKVFDEVDVPSRDLVIHGRKGMNVMDESVFHKYFDHYKGDHWRRYGI